ncbi:MAG: M55 family metallopeptidase [Emergencia sp.]
MKVYISADIEGVTGVTSWDETELNHADHAAAAKQMTMETLAACQAAIECGADEIYVKDAHDSARNMDITLFPDNVKVIRGWTNTPESMMAGIDETFDAAVFIGYHSGAGFDGNPLSHTMNLDNIYVKINGKPAAEFDMNAYVAAYYGVPVVFVSGDEALCSHARELVPAIETTGVKSGQGNATFNLAPEKACRLIREGVKKGLGKLEECRLESPDSFEMEISFKECVRALRGSFYPGCEQIDARTVRFTGKDIQEMMTARMFIL